MRCRVSVIFLGLIILAGCSDSGISPPTGSADASVDSAPRPEAGAIDSAPSIDVAQVDGFTPCDRDLGKMTLVPNYCVYAKFETTAAAFTLSGNTLWTYEQTGNEHKVQEWQLAAGQTALVAPQDFFSFTLSGTDVIYPNSYLARSAAGFLALGYNNDDFSNPAGQIMVGSKGKKPGSVEKANGNFSAVFYNDKTLLINASVGIGKAQEGQGLYVYGQDTPEESWKLVSGLGEASGFTLINKDALFVGGYFFADSKSKLFAFSRKAVAAAIASKTPLNATTDGVLAHEGAVLSAALLGNSLIMARADESFAFTDVITTPFSLDAADKVELSPIVKTAILANDSGANVVAMAADSGKVGILFNLAGGKDYIVIMNKSL